MTDFYFQFTHLDEPYLPILKGLVAGRAKISISSEPFMMDMQVAMRAKEKGAKGVITTSPKLLAQLLGMGNSIESLDKYSGSIIHKHDLDWLILDPLEQLHTVSYGKFLCKRYLSKFLSPQEWSRLPSFSFEVFNPEKKDYWVEFMNSCTYIAVDIETGLEGDRVINCISFTGVSLRGRNSCGANTVVLPCDSEYNIAVIRTLLSLAIPKVFQNGKYDIAYLLRYNIIPINYSFDTINLFHCWYSELPKDLATIISYCMHDWVYHKDMGKAYSFPSLEYLEYNARDSFSTAMSFLTILMEAPEYVWSNYAMEFPQVFPCILAELTGIRINPTAQEALSQELKVFYEARLNKLRIMVHNAFYNPGSWQQNLKLFEVLGSGDIKSSDSIHTDKVMSRHPLNKRILKQVDKYKEEKKRDDTYVGKEFTWNGRCYYSINPHGTDTGRNASKKSAFWCGLQIQNIPVNSEPGEPVIKSMFEADEGFYIGECDAAQNEARGTGYISGDTNLIAAVESGRDYHAVNAERFFGIPYDKIIGPNGDIINKPIRNLSKRTNHGANYNMGEGVLIDTMGIDKVIAAKHLLGLPAKWSLKQVAGHLLESYDKAYPVVRGAHYAKIMGSVVSTGLLVGPTGWTRYCFSDPSKSKRAVNMYAAHVPQSFAAMNLNKAWLRVFTEIALVEGPKEFKLFAQIHDSILFSYRIGRSDLAFKVKKIMEETSHCKVTDTFGITRDFKVPCDLKGENKIWSELKDMKESTPRLRKVA